MFFVATPRFEVTCLKNLGKSMSSFLFTTFALCPYVTRGAHPLRCSNTLLLKHTFFVRKMREKRKLVGAPRFAII